MNEIDEIRYRLATLENDVGELRARVVGTVAAPAPWRPPPQPAQPPRGMPQPPPAPQVHQAAPHSIAVPPPDARGEANFFGVWFARLGAAAVLIGVAFGFKYAVDQGLLTTWMRVVLGWVIGTSALVWGDATIRRGYRALGQAGAAGGIGVLYLSTLAGLTLYDLYPATGGVALLTLVAAIGGWLAVRNDSISLAAMASIAAYGVALLIGLDRGAPGTVYTYVAVVDLGVLGVFVTRRWNALAPLAGIATWVLVVLRLDDAAPAVAVAFGALFLFLFSAAGVTTSAQQGRFETSSKALVVASTFAYLGVGLHVLPSGRGVFVLTLAAAWALVAVASTSNAVEQADVEPTAWALCAALLVVAVPVQLDGSAVGVAWSIQGALLSWLSRRSPNWRFALGAALVLGLGFASTIPHLVMVYLDDAGVLTSYTVIVGLHVASMLASARWLSEKADERAEALGATAGVLAAFVALGWLSAEVIVYAERGGASLQSVQFGLSAAWAIYSASLLAAGIAAGRKWPRMFALGLLAVVLVKLALLDLWMLPTLQRTLAFVMLGLVLLLCSFMYHRLLATLLGGAGSAGPQNGGQGSAGPQNGGQEVDAEPG